MTRFSDTELSRFARFSAVGTVGFVVDVSVLTVMVALFGGYYSGRVVSFLSAATFTWWGNRHFTFSKSKSRNLFLEWARFLAANSAGGALNYSVYALLLNISSIARDWPILPVAAGTLCGLCANYLLSKRFVFLAKNVVYGRENH